MPTAWSQKSAARPVRNIWKSGTWPETLLHPGQAVGDVDADALKRLMIRRTIQEHLDKEMRLRRRASRCSSLFFIDAVEYYRSYDADGNPVKGKYALIFEEEYRRLRQASGVSSLFKEVDLEFRRRRGPRRLFLHRQEGTLDRHAENNQGNRENAERAYNLIMKDKEKLLSFETKLKFIFSHSALREGWDNPNVFQICALREMGTERERRQTIGRGLRLCVNQQGERLRGFDVNTLTVIATESYEQFAENLQKEIEEDTGIRFGIVEKHQFAAIPVTMTTAGPLRWGWSIRKPSGRTSRKQAMSMPRARYRTHLRKALKDDTLHLPEPFQAQLQQVKESFASSPGNSTSRTPMNAVDQNPRRRFCTARNSRRFGTASSKRRPTVSSLTTRS